MITEFYFYFSKLFQSDSITLVLAVKTCQSTHRLLNWNWKTLSHWLDKMIVIIFQLRNGSSLCTWISWLWIDTCPKFCQQVSSILKSFLTNFQLISATIMYHFDKNKMSCFVPFYVLDGTFVSELRPLKSLATSKRIAVILPVDVVYFIWWIRVHVAAICGSVIRFTGVSFEGGYIAVSYTHLTLPTNREV
mgnify:CR=1 FL=1